MLKKTIAVLILLTMLLSAFASCGNIKPTSTPTDAPTNEPTVEPTEAETDVPTEECTHEWNIVSQCTHCEEIQTLAGDDEQIKYDFFGAYKVLPYDSSIDWQHGKEVTNKEVLDVLNQGIWEKEVLAIDYDYKLALNDKILWYSAVRGVFANVADNTHLQLSYEERLKVKNVLKENGLLNLEDWHPSSSGGQIMLTSYGPGYAMIDDEQERELLWTWVSEALENGTFEGESTAGHYGASFTLTAEPFWGTIRFVIWDETRYSTSLHEDGYGYQYFYRADLSEIYNYLNEHYPEEFWYSDRH